MTNHPITPPPELVQQWYNECPEANEASLPYVATQAARWGADQELEACCEWLKVQETRSEKWFSPKHDACALAGDLRAARRPKPPSLKEQALAALSEADQGLNKSEWQQCSNTIRRALEQLDD